MASLTHANIEHLRMDVTDDNSVNSAIEEVIQKEGRIDMLVNNAGVICSGTQCPSRLLIGHTNTDYVRRFYHRRSVGNNSANL